MRATGICILVIGGIMLLTSGINFCAYWIFEKFPNKTERALGKLYSHNHKKDVAVWSGLGKFDGPPKVAFNLKHLTKTKYMYRVNNSQYLCSYHFWQKPHKIPNDAWVIYLKAFPRISYLHHEDNCIGSFDFLAKAIIFLVIGISAIGLGTALL